MPASSTYSDNQTPDSLGLSAGEAVREDLFGRRAWKLARLKQLGLPVPDGAALSFACVRRLAEGGAFPDLSGLLRPGRPLVVRCSPGERAWGGPAALCNIGLGEEPSPGGFRQLVLDFAHSVHGLDQEGFDGCADGAASLLKRYSELTGEEFPRNPLVQLEAVCRAFAGHWSAVSSRMLREARGAPVGAGLGLIVQEAEYVAEQIGEIQLADSVSGQAGVFGIVRLPGREGPDCGAAGSPDIPVAQLPDQVLNCLKEMAGAANRSLKDSYRLEFLLAGGGVCVLDAVPVRRTGRAAVQISVDLADSGGISTQDALLRIEPRSLAEFLHAQIAPAAERDVFVVGHAASPGAASGRIVFSAEAAQALAAKNEPAVLVRTETGPEDIRGMHSAKAVLTIRGGMTSHAAVIARGIGLPCVVGASDLRLDFVNRLLSSPDGRSFGEGDVITLDGTSGEALAGAAEMVAAEPGVAFSRLLEWADGVRRLGVRANADTPAEVRAALEFRADGLGLCRTEHMFFAPDRINVMREVLLARSDADRDSAIVRLLPMQRADFEEIFDMMDGRPVTIRLLDLPLHEFLPDRPEEVAEFADAMGLPEEQIRARARELAEVNPMLGMRGVRLGLAMPTIYAMQVRAIFEAAIAAGLRAGAPVVPEIMVPLVSAHTEVELVCRRIEAVLDEVERERGVRPDYKVGIMVETPRAALRAGDIAMKASFFSFGTNDLTQMSYGLSRDDAGRFMRDYVNGGVFAEDPFHSLDVEGVGELMLIAARRGRARNPDLELGLCGEHGGDPASVRFCKLAGFTYVSCSPFRVPIARLAAAQATLLGMENHGSGGWV